MKVDGSLKSLLQGVSQQPPRERLPGQASIQENMLSDPVTGLTRRPPTDLIGVLGTATNVRGWHTMSTRDGKRFLVWYHDNDVQVFDLNAIEFPVTISGAAAPYLNTGNTFRSSTDEDDVTLVANPAFTPAMLADVPAYFNGNAAIIQVLGGQYGKTYTVSVNGTVAATHNTPDGSIAAHAAQIDTKVIATALANGVNASLGPSGYSANIKEDVFYITGPAPFTITATDGYGNINIKHMNDTVNDVGDLPRIAPHLYVARVAEKTDPDKDLWFKFTAAGQENNLVPSAAYFGQSGYWQECVAPGVPFKINTSTMPHVLTYNSGAGTFTFDRAGWRDRRIGTRVSNPNPSFIGNPIKDVSSFQGRGVLIAGNNVCMSRTNSPLDHWFGSASALTDTDPIDINSTIESSNLESAVQHNRDLVVFSNEAQFVVFGRTKATPSNASLVLTTQFESEIKAHPVGAGKNVFFASNYGRYTAVREFFAEGNTDINDSRPITQHIKRYIEGRALHLTASSNYDTLLVHTDDNQSRVYVYQYIWADNEKVQAAWHVWISKHPIVYSMFDDDRVYFVQKVGNVYYLLRQPLDVQVSDGVPYPVHLDQRFDVFGVNTAFILPYDYLKDDELVCVQGADCPNPGLLAPIESITYDVENVGWRVTLKKSMEGGNIVVGTKYMSKYRPTNPFVKDADGVVVGTGNLRVRNWILSLFETGEITGKTISKYGDGSEVRFNGRIVGDIDNVVGEQPLSSEEFIMPFRQDTDEAEVEFYTDSHMPLTLLDIEWQGQYSKRGRRIGSGGSK
jgi:hypothetical protein